jgi:AmmeMemoRadiSam system protein B
MRAFNLVIWASDSMLRHPKSDLSPVSGDNEKMGTRLPRLRLNLDFMPSPLEDRPGLLIRDPFQYSDATLILPPPLISCLEFYDGEHTDLDVKEMIVRVTGDIQAASVEGHLTSTLSSAGFLEDEAYERLRDERHRQFAENPSRSSAHAGSAYPEEPQSLELTMRRYMDSERNGSPGDARPIGIAAPHVSPEGGWQSYQAAYSCLDSHGTDPVFVILGTSHYGQPERFGLTRKPFVTPFGEARTETRLVDELAARAGDAVVMEDYCHAVEHSIEFQVIFLQHLYGASVRILPVLCGAFAHSIYLGGKPEQDDGVHAFLDSLGEIAAREGERLCWVLGVDMAHIGRRYGDALSAEADSGEMLVVAGRDRQRIDCMSAGDADGFWQLVQENRDDLKWCGSSPIYTFLRAVPGVRGKLERYQQWNIDSESVVSFAGMTFRR